MSVDSQSSSLNVPTVNAITGSEARGQTTGSSVSATTGAQAGAHAGAGGDISCVGCGQANQRSRRFCASCGANLFRPCQTCEKENALSERFCGSCGTNLEKVFLDRWEKLHSNLVIAWRRTRECRFDEARARVSGGSFADDPRLEIFSQVNALLAKEISKRQEIAVARAEDTRQEIEIAREQGNMPKLVRALRSLPAALRTDQEQNELRLADLSLVELKTLRDQIETTLQGVKEKRVKLNAGDLLNKVNRVLELDPTEDKLRSLAEQLAKRKQAEDQSQRKDSVQEAKDCLAQHDYINALRHIESIPESAWDKRLDSYRNELRELAWLEQELRMQPFVSMDLFQFAKKLATLQTDDKRATAWRDRLQQMVARLQKNAEVAEHHLWTKLPQETTLGAPILPILRPKSMQVPDEDVAVQSARRMGQLTVAYGLALQGLGLAEIDLNLIAEKKSGFGKLFAKPKDDVAWGVDVGAHAIKVVSLAKDAAGFRLAACEVFEHETPLPRLDYPDAKQDTIRETMKRVLEKHDLKSGKVGVAVSGNRSLGRFFQIPAIDRDAKNSAKRIKDLIRFEAEAQIPFPLEDVSWDAHIFGDSDGKAGPQSVALVAAKKEDISETIKSFEKAELKPDFAQAECFALYNVLAHELLAKTSPEPDAQGSKSKGPEKPKLAIGKTVAIIESGCQTTNVVIGSANHVWFRSFAFAGEEFTRRLVRALKITHEQADTAKHEPWRANRVYFVADALSDALQEWSVEVKRTFKAHANMHPKSQVSQVLLSGGATRTLGLQKLLVRGK